MSDPHNEPAYPVVESDPNMGTRVTPGMSIWDYFAAAAMVTMSNASFDADATEEDMARLLAERAGLLADAMCAERAKRRQG